MNTKNIKWTAAGLVGIVALVVICSGLLASSQAPALIDPSLAETILHNTLQIRLYVPLTRDAHGYVMSQGLGSLVVWQGATVIVTHNHWGEMLENAEYAKILDDQGNLLLKLGMDELRNLILYSDPGTLVLSAPDGLPAGINLDEHSSMVAGDVVALVHQDSEIPDKVSLLQARVANLKNYKGQPVYKLALLDDSQIIPGDSGGGIWVDGKLAGNMWASYFDTVKLPFLVETSLAAPLPHIQLADTEEAGSVSFLQPSLNGLSELAIAEEAALLQRGL